MYKGRWAQFVKVTNEIPCVKSDSFIGNPHPLSCDCSINVTNLTQRVISITSGRLTQLTNSVELVSGEGTSLPPTLYDASPTVTRYWPAFSFEMFWRTSVLCESHCDVPPPCAETPTECWTPSWTSLTVRYSEWLNLQIKKLLSTLIPGDWISLICFLLPSSPNRPSSCKRCEGRGWVKGRSRSLLVCQDRGQHCSTQGGRLQKVWDFRWMK